MNNATELVGNNSGRDLEYGPISPLVYYNQKQRDLRPWLLAVVMLSLAVFVLLTLTTVLAVMAFGSVKSVASPNAGVAESSKIPLVPLQPAAHNTTASTIIYNTYNINYNGVNNIYPACANHSVLPNQPSTKPPNVASTTAAAQKTTATVAVTSPPTATIEAKTTNGVSTTEQQKSTANLTTTVTPTTTVEPTTTFKPTTTIKPTTPVLPISTTTESKLTTTTLWEHFSKRPSLLQWLFSKKSFPLAGPSHHAPVA